MNAIKMRKLNDKSVLDIKSISILTQRKIHLSSTIFVKNMGYNNFIVKSVYLCHCEGAKRLWQSRLRLLQGKPLIMTEGKSHCETLRYMASNSNIKEYNHGERIG